VQQIQLLGHQLITGVAVEPQNLEMPLGLVLVA
jgi:hypothetical protein